MKPTPKRSRYFYGMILVALVTIAVPTLILVDHNNQLASIRRQMLGQSNRINYLESKVRGAHIMQLPSTFERPGSDFSDY